MNYHLTDLYRWEGNPSIYQCLVFDSREKLKSYLRSCRLLAHSMDNYEALERINRDTHYDFESKSGAVVKFRAVKISSTENKWVGVIREGDTGELIHQTSQEFINPYDAVDHLFNEYL